MIEYHIHIRYTDQFKQVGVREKNNRNEINSAEDNRFWLATGPRFKIPRVRYTFYLASD